MSVPTYDAIKVPSHIKTILITGAGGFVGQKLTQVLLERLPNVKLITTDIVEPPKYLNDASRLRVVKADLGKQAELDGLFEGEVVGGVFALQEMTRGVVAEISGIMSGGSEANFDLGYSVNVDSHVALLKKVHAHAKEHGLTGAKKPVHVFVSSLAIYGGPKCKPTDHVKPDDTPLLPGTSYGVEKNIVELYCYDYGRKGYLDTRSVRLPTVCIRSGAPSTAASSFISGLIREPLQGIPSECPIASGPDDPMLDSMAVYITRVKTVVRNIAYAICMPESMFRKGESRSINLPGVSINTRQILKALEEHGGPEATKLVSFKVDPAVLAICETWAGDYDSTEPLRMGFEVDDKIKGYGLAVQDFKEELASGTKAK